MLRGSLHQRRADPLASLPRHDEDALDVCGQPTGRSRSRHTRDERDPGHADDLWSKESGHERQVRVPVCSPPLRELHRECVNGPLIWFLLAGVQPQEPGQVRDVVPIRLADDHKVSLSSGVEPQRPTAVRQTSQASSSAPPTLASRTTYEQIDPQLLTIAHRDVPQDGTQVNAENQQPANGEEDQDERELHAQRLAGALPLNGPVCLLNKEFLVSGLSHARLSPFGNAPVQQAPVVRNIRKGLAPLTSRFAPVRSSGQR